MENVSVISRGMDGGGIKLKIDGQGGGGSQLDGEGSGGGLAFIPDLILSDESSGGLA